MVIRELCTFDKNDFCLAAGITGASGYVVHRVIAVKYDELQFTLVVNQ